MMNHKWMGFLCADQGKIIDTTLRESANIQTKEDLEDAQKERAKQDSAFNDLDKQVGGEARSSLVLCGSA